MANTANTNDPKLTEEDVKLRYISPAILNSRWEKQNVRMEYKVTDGRIIIENKKDRRGSPEKADYVLFVSETTPIAVVEAKSFKKTNYDGIQQAIKYAQKLGAPFAYASNGKSFLEHDFTTGVEREIPLNQFPTPEVLFERWNNSEHFNEVQENLIKQKFYTANAKEPRYYQLRAVNAALDAIAKEKDRLLLVLATGTGKTYIAFQLVYRLLQSGLKKKILYLADRNILVDQSIQQDFAPLEKVIHKIDVSKENKLTIGSYQVYFALYQQLVGADGDKDNYSKLFDPNFFDLIIVDECHRGSAKEDSQWRKILDYFKSATQLGMTATPKETAYASNISYFGEPLYTYSLKQGIEDGFLSPFKVIRFNLNIGDGWRPLKDQKDINGEVIKDRVYDNTDYDYNIVIEDRTIQVAKEITKYLKYTDRFAKTIVFTPTEDAAARMRGAIVNENTDLVKENPDYVVRITGSDKEGKDKLKYFISVAEKYPVIATTSKLLSTGVDCKMTKVIVLDSMINSMTEFKQIIGRGTRIKEEAGKTHFVVLDFRNVTRLFADPDWDGPIVIDPNYPPKGTDDNKTSTDPVVDVPTTPRYIPHVDKDGCKVEVLQKIVSVYNVDGQLLSTESITDYTKKNVLDNYATLDEFINAWSAEKKKIKIRELFDSKKINLEALKEDQNMADVDDFDFICHLAYDRKPLTRKERAENVKNRDFFSKYSGVAKEILEALLDKYKNEGIYAIETSEILKNAPFIQFGKPSKIASYFGGIDEYYSAVTELEQAIYANGMA